MKEQKYLKNLVKITTIIMGIVIVVIYFFFEKKNESTFSSIIKKDQQIRKTNFTKITSFLHRFYIALVILFLVLLTIIPN